jgi:hypothetical protein
MGLEAPLTILPLKLVAQFYFIRRLSICCLFLSFTKPLDLVASEIGGPVVILQKLSPKGLRFCLTVSLFSICTSCRPPLWHLSRVSSDPSYFWGIDIESYSPAQALRRCSLSKVPEFESRITLIGTVGSAHVRTCVTVRTIVMVPQQE